jgi:23S rRNA pseudouridine2605 synthase
MENEMEKIRLQKFIADAGLMSRRAAEAEIEAGNLSVNGHLAFVGQKVDPREDVVTYKGKRVRYERRAHTYIMLNKPRGYLSSTADDRGRKCVTDLLDGISARVYPVGRLDLISEGMLLLTDDGELKNRLTHPSHTIGKVYRVKVAEPVSDEQYEILTSALEIDGYKIKPVEVTLGESDESGTVMKMTLFEGRNRQIRKMCEAAGLTVKRLSRVSIGNLKLDGLPVGKWRELSEDEVEYLYKATRNKTNV